MNKLITALLIVGLLSSCSKDEEIEVYCKTETQYTFVKIQGITNANGYRETISEPYTDAWCSCTFFWAMEVGDTSSITYNRNNSIGTSYRVLNIDTREVCN